MKVRHVANAVSSAGLLTPQDFFAWEQANTNVLRERDERNADVVQDVVIREVTRMMQNGMTLTDAGTILARRFCYGHRNGVTFTPSAVRRALRALGWRASKRQQAKGGEA